MGFFRISELPLRVKNGVLSWFGAHLFALLLATSHMRLHKKALKWGFLFGAVGLYILAALAMLSQILETAFTPIFYTGRWVVRTYIGANGTDWQVLLVTLFNGVFYALVFWIIAEAVHLFQNRPVRSVTNQKK